MVRLATTLLLAFLVIGPAMAAYRAERSLARDPADGRLLYVEEHALRFNAEGGLLERHVLYRCADGTAFARKRVDYRPDAEAPDFELQDARSGYREGLRSVSGGREAFVQRPGDAERATRLRPGPLVADAGFDVWVRRAWPRLLAGERLRVDFLVPSRRAVYAFDVQALASAPATDEPRFRLRLGGWLGWFAPYIDVTYTGAERRLLRFEGLSNLRDDRGQRPLVVRIDFPEPATASDAAAFAALQAEPLRACRVSG